MNLGNNVDEAYISEILKPLHKEKTSIEYVCLYKAVVDFNKRLRALEAVHADIYAKIANLEKEIQI